MGTSLGQQKEYLLRGGQYASCVHAGGLSCFTYSFEFFFGRVQYSPRWAISYGKENVQVLTEEQKDIGRLVMSILSPKGTRCVLITTHGGGGYTADKFVFKAFDCGGSSNIYSIMCEKQLGGQ